jgi:hypothetical protein
VDSCGVQHESTATCPDRADWSARCGTMTCDDGLRWLGCLLMACKSWCPCGTLRWRENGGQAGVGAGGLPRWLGGLPCTLQTVQLLPTAVAFGAELRPDPFPAKAASLPPCSLATTRTGLSLAGDDELPIRS